MVIGVGGEVKVERKGVQCEEREQNFQRFAVHGPMGFALSLSRCALLGCLVEMIYEMYMFLDST